MIKNFFFKERKKRTLRIAALEYRRVKMKESEKRDAYLDLARKLKKLWNMRVTIIPIEVGKRDNSKGLERGIEGFGFG